MSTGRDLDVAVQGAGWIAVQGLDGSEAYTRAGDLQVDPNGQLLTGTGLAGAGRWRSDHGAAVRVDHHRRRRHDFDRAAGAGAGDHAPTSAASSWSSRPTRPSRSGDDGLLRMKDGSDAPADAAVQLASGVLESSNVNVADAMVNMIELQRHFDMQVRAMKSAEDNGAASARLLFS